MGGGLCGCGGLSGGGGSGGNDGGGGNAGGGVNVYVNCPLQKQQATNGVTPTAYNRSSVRMRKTELHWTLYALAGWHVTLVGAVCPDRSRFANRGVSHSRTMMPADWAVGRRRWRRRRGDGDGGGRGAGGGGGGRGGSGCGGGDGAATRRAKRGAPGRRAGGRRHRIVAQEPVRSRDREGEEAQQQNAHTMHWRAAGALLADSVRAAGRSALRTPAWLTTRGRPRKGGSRATTSPLRISASVLATKNSGCTAAQRRAAARRPGGSGGSAQRAAACVAVTIRVQPCQVGSMPPTKPFRHGLRSNWLSECG